MESEGGRGVIRLSYVVYTQHSTVHNTAQQVQPIHSTTQQLACCLASPLLGLTVTGTLFSKGTH